MTKRVISRAALLLAVGAVMPSAFATDYYFSAGSSGGDGSQASPYGSLSLANSLDFNAGDNVFLKGTFSGGLQLTGSDSGTAAAPVNITSWGNSAATINAGNGYGIRALNAGGISISNLNLVGSGPSSKDSTGLYTNTDSGIRFFNDAGKQDYVRINKVNVSGFGENGIYIQGGSNQSGFNDVKITNSSAFLNQRAGVSVDADFDTANRNAVTNLTIDNVKAYNNPGRANRPEENNSGNGIVIGQVNGAVIQHSTAWGNGTADASENGGSVGIWAWDANNVKIQYNESFKNGTAGKHDGGGFDLDGGVTNSVIQFNYSHDNAGAGYLLAQFKNAKNFTGNEVSNNISVDDGRKNGYGALHAFGKIDDTVVKDNLVFLSPAEKGQENTRGEAPAGIKLRGSQTKDIDFVDNLIFLLNDGDSSKYQPTKFENTANASGVTLDGNEYKLLTGSASDSDNAKLLALIDSLGDDLSSGKTVSIDADALAKYLSSEDPVDPVAPPVVITDPKDPIVEVITKPPVSDPLDLGGVTVSDPVKAAIPEPSTLGLMSVAAVGMLRRRRRSA